MTVQVLLASVCLFALQAQAPDLLTEARRAVGSGEIAAAEQTVRSYLAAHQGSADGYFLLGHILFKKKDPKASLAAYTKGARFRKPGATDLEVVGCDYVLLKDYTDADKWFTESVALEPSNLSALYYLARTKYNENRFEEAIGAFLQCLKFDPKNVKYEDNLGLSYQALGRNDEASAAYRAAIEWDKNSASHNSGPYLDLGGLLVDTGNPADAIPLLEQAAAISPQDVRTLTQLGKAYLHADLLDKAQTEFEAAVRLEPRNAPVHFMLAQVYRKRGLLDKARSESQTYSSLNQDRSSGKTTE